MRCSWSYSEDLRALTESVASGEGRIVLLLVRKVKINQAVIQSSGNEQCVAGRMHRPWPSLQFSNLNRTLRWYRSESFLPARPDSRAKSHKLATAMVALALIVVDYNSRLLRLWLKTDWQSVGPTAEGRGQLQHQRPTNRRTHK